MHNSVYEKFLKEIEYQNQRWSNQQYAILIEVIPWVTNYDQELWDTICTSYYHDIDELPEAPMVVVDGKTYKWHEDVMDALGDGFTMKMLPIMLELGATVRPTYYINSPDERVRYFFDVIVPRHEKRQFFDKFFDAVRSRN